MTVGLSSSPLLTDYYQLTMADAYLQCGMTDTAVFEFYVRNLPDERHFLIAAGLDQALQFLEELHFSSETLHWLSDHQHASPRLVDYLSKLRFEGDVDALPEGSVFFPNEPIFRLTAPLPVAQLVESRLINLLHIQTLIASKAARMVLAAPGKQLVDFGLRRAHGGEAGLLAARAAYLAGFVGTATMLAGQKYGIPLYGTMGHSFILAHENEQTAFEDFARVHPDKTILLIDTYNTYRGARRVVEAAKRLKNENINIRGVRIDSGDLATDTRMVRQVLDAAGLQSITIFTSGNLDEYQIARLEQQGAPIDGYGVGTRMDVSDDAPYLECAYKLQEYAGQPRRKRSQGKANWPGRKQIFRRHTADGQMSSDYLTLSGTDAKGTPLLQPVMRQGRRIDRQPGLADSRAYTQQELARLPLSLRGQSTSADDPYPVIIAPSLHALADRLDATDD